MRFLPLLALFLVGCGPAEKPPTPDEAAAFKGKEITPEQRAKGMAAAMPGGAAKTLSPSGG